MSLLVQNDVCGAPGSGRLLGADRYPGKQSVLRCPWPALGCKGNVLAVGRCGFLWIT